MFSRWISMCCAAFLSTSAGAASVPVFVGTQGEDGIFLLSLDSETGALSKPKLASKVLGASSLALSPDRKVLFAAIGVREKESRKKLGGVASFAIGADYGLTPLSSQLTQGRGACHLFAGSKGKHVFVANYSTGCVASFNVTATGKLSPVVSHHQHSGKSVHPKRQASPHAHSVYASPDNKFVYVADLGIDKVMIYRLDSASGKLTAAGSADLAAGSGPRHMAFDKKGEFLYVLNELTLTISKFKRDPETGALALEKTKKVTSMPTDTTLTCSEIRLSDDGKFLYVAKRDLADKGRDTICVIDPASLDLIQEQATGVAVPRHFNLSPSGKWLLIAGQRGNKVVVLARDVQSGKLSKTAHSAELNAPMWILFP